MRLLVALFLSAFVTASASAQDPEEAAVLAAAQQLFDGINQKDGDLIRSAMMPEGVLFSTANRDGVDQAFFTSAEDFAAQVESTPRDFHERMFETTVHIRKGIALVWAAYDFHVDGVFSHCGVDTFSLVKTADGWKVVSLTYTIEQEGCGDRPPIPDNG